MRSKPFYKKVALMIVIILTLVIAVPAMGAPGNNTRVWVEYTAQGKSDVEASLNRGGADFHFDFPELNSFVVSLPENAVTALQNNPNVISIEEDPPRYLYANTTDSFVAAMSAAADITGPNGQTIPWGIDAVQARDVWDADRDGSFDTGAPTGAGRTVCIIDSGYYQAHEDLGVAAGGYSQVDDDWTRDGFGHGTHVAGTIAGINNDTGVVGVAPNVSLYIVKFFNDAGSATFASDLVAAANNCAANGANIISMSLGGDRSNGKENNAFNSLNNQGILSIAAAGNDYTTNHSYPASYSSVVSVAAVDESLAIADFSQQTSQVELSGPGVAVTSTLPYIDDNTFDIGASSYDVLHVEYSGRGTASGNLVDGGLCDSVGSWSGAVVLCERGAVSFFDKVNNVELGGGAAAIIYNNEPGIFLGTLGDGNSTNIIGLSMSQEDGQALVAGSLGQTSDITSTFTWPVSGYQAWDGTSMATPHVSAVAALIWSVNPSWTNAEIRDALVQTATDLGPAGRDNAFGYGLVQAADALAFLGGGTVDNPPVVTIDSPSNGSSHDSATSISFSGSSIDAEDGDISAGLVWTSSIDGQIGTGASFSATLSDGTHTITATSTDSGSNEGSDSVSVTVGGGGGGDTLVVTVTTDKATYVNNEVVYITTTVTDGTNPVAGATVDIEIVSAGGTLLTGSSTTDANGILVMTYSVKAGRDGRGTYSVTSTASMSGYTGGIGTTTFEVQ